MGRVAQLVQTLIFHLKRGKWTGSDKEMYWAWKELKRHEGEMTINKATPTCGAPCRSHLGRVKCSQETYLVNLVVGGLRNGPTDFKSWKDTNRTERTWKGHVTWKKRKWMHMLRNEMIRQAMTTNQKLFQKGWKTLVTTTTPLRIVFLGSYRRTPMRDRLKARFKNLFNWGSRIKEI